MTNNINIVFVNYYSEIKIKRYLKQFKDRFNVIIVNNSHSDNITKITKHYKNVKVICNKRNIGFGAASNKGLKKIKSNYGLHLDIDTKFSNKNIFELFKLANKIKNFGVIGPKILNYKYKRKDFKNINFKDGLKSMNFIDGCCLLFNMKALKKVGYFDENFFLYYEEFDLLKRLIDQNFKVYMTNKISILHKGRSSTDKKYNYEIELNRNWHLLWSKFYFYKKHYGYIFAFFKIFNQFISSFIKSTLYFLTNNEFKKKIYLARLSGCLNSIFLRNSWYRPKIKN